MRSVPGSPVPQPTRVHFQLIFLESRGVDAAAAQRGAAAALQARGTSRGVLVLFVRVRLCVKCGRVCVFLWQLFQRRYTRPFCVLYVDLWRLTFGPLKPVAVLQPTLLLLLGPACWKLSTLRHFGRLIYVTAVRERVVKLDCRRLTRQAASIWGGGGDESRGQLPGGQQENTAVRGVPNYLGCNDNY